MKPVDLSLCNDTMYYNTGFNAGYNEGKADGKEEGARVIFEEFKKICSESHPLNCLITGETCSIETCPIAKEVLK